MSQGQSAKSRGRDKVQGLGGGAWITRRGSGMGGEGLAEVTWWWALFSLGCCQTPPGRHFINGPIPAKYCARSTIPSSPRSGRGRRSSFKYSTMRPSLHCRRLTGTCSKRFLKNHTVSHSLGSDWVQWVEPGSSGWSSDPGCIGHWFSS